MIAYKEKWQQEVGADFPWRYQDNALENAYGDFVKNQQE